MSKNVCESDKEPRKITRLRATKSHLIKLVYSLGEGAIKICYRKLQVVRRFSLLTFGKIKERKRRKNKDIMGDKKKTRYLWLWECRFKLQIQECAIDYNLLSSFPLLLFNRRQKIWNERQVCFYFLTYHSLTISLITIGDTVLHCTAPLQLTPFRAHANMNSFVAYEIPQDLRWCMWNSRKLPYDISGKLTKGCEQSETARAAALKS